MGTIMRRWPFPLHPVIVPQGPDHPGAFGAAREYDRHTGIDLYAPEGRALVAMEDGIVVGRVALFTGADDDPKRGNGESIWLPTSALLVESMSGVIVYGEIEIFGTREIGSAVLGGEIIGKVKRVLRPKPDGRPYRNPANSPSMLHLELYRHGTKSHVAQWPLGTPQPEGLLDPTEFLSSCER